MHIYRRSTRERNNYKVSIGNPKHPIYTPSSGFVQKILRQDEPTPRSSFRPAWHNYYHKVLLQACPLPLISINAFMKKEPMRKPEGRGSKRTASSNWRIKGDREGKRKKVNKFYFNVCTYNMPTVYSETAFLLNTMLTSSRFHWILFHFRTQIEKLYRCGLHKFVLTTSIKGPFRKSLQG